MQGTCFPLNTQHVLPLIPETGGDKLRTGTQEFTVCSAPSHQLLSHPSTSHNKQDGICLLCCEPGMLLALHPLWMHRSQPCCPKGIDSADIFLAPQLVQSHPLPLSHWEIEAFSAIGIIAAEKRRIRSVCTACWDIQLRLCFA